MHALTLLLANLLAQPFETGPVPFDVSAALPDLKVVTDGKDHYMVFQSKMGLSGMLFYGDGKTFYRLRSPGGGSSGDESFNFSLWDPRFANRPEKSGFSMKTDEKLGKQYEVSCGSRTTAMTLLPEADATKLLKAAAFKGPLWTRAPMRLLRDDSGVYYFIDIQRSDDYEHRDHRVFSGPRGKMKMLPLKSVVDDSEGVVLATRDGSLRLVAGSRTTDSDEKVNSKHLKWVAGKREVNLIDVPIDYTSNAALIYNDLGVYDGQRLGTPCDDLK